MKVEIIELLKLPARICGAIVCSCLFLLFFPAICLPFPIDDFRTQYGIWIFLVFCASFALYFSYIMVWIKKQITDSISSMKRNSSLKILTKNEKMFLRKYISNSEQTVYAYKGSVGYDAYKTMLLLVDKKIVKIVDDDGDNKIGIIHEQVFKKLLTNPNLLNVEDAPNEQ